MRLLAPKPFFRQEDASAAEVAAGAEVDVEPEGNAEVEEEAEGPDEDPSQADDLAILDLEDSSAEGSQEVCG